jgi:aminobenzoyl-glutamate utilization protein B
MDAIIDWHPWNHHSANYDTCNAYFNARYHFKGRTAHGNAPWNGRSALDGALLMGHAIELLREHVKPGSPEAANTINYTFSDVGPEYPSVVPDRSTLWVVGRITTAREMEEIMGRIQKCADGASVATGTSVETEVITATHEKIPNRKLASVIYQNLAEIGPPKFDIAEQEFAKKLQRTLGMEEVGFTDEVMEFGSLPSAVTDNSEFSWFAPFAMAWILSAPSGIPWHNWQVTACAGSTIGKKGMIVGSKVLATSAVDLFTQPRLLEEAKQELTTRLASKTYKPLIPPNSAPPIDINRSTMEKYRLLMKPHYEF